MQTEEHRETMRATGKIPIGSRVYHLSRMEYGILLDPREFLCDESSSVVRFDKTGETLEVSTHFLEKAND